MHLDMDMEKLQALITSGKEDEANELLRVAVEKERNKIEKENEKLWCDKERLKEQGKNNPALNELIEVNAEMLANWDRYLAQYFHT